MPVSLLLILRRAVDLWDLHSDFNDKFDVDLVHAVNLLHDTDTWGEGGGGGGGH